MDLRGPEPAGSSGENRPTPKSRVVNAAVFAAVVGSDQGEAKRQRDGGVQSERHERLAQVVALAPLRVHGRVRDSQYLGSKSRIFRNQRGHLTGIDLRVARQIDDL